MASQRNENSTLDTAPGPCPWYFGPDCPRVTGRKGPYRWEQISDSEAEVSLHRADGAAVLVVGMYCYIKPTGTSRFAAWYSAEVPHGEDYIAVYLFDADKLNPIGDVTSASKRLDDSQRLWAGSDALAAFEVPLSLSPGQHDLMVPNAFREVGELLLLGNSTSRDIADGPQAGGTRCVYAIDPAVNTVAAYPQDWFNRGGYDFGYSWITRVARDPETGRIVGDGVRIGPFVLDETNRNRLDSN